MKKLLILLLAATAALPPCRAIDPSPTRPLAVDMTTNAPTTPLNIGGANVTGTVNAARLPIGTTASTVSAGNDARWLNTLTAESFGAVGNGTTDDSAAIQAALDVASAGGGGVVALNPTKRYGISPGGVTIPAMVTLTFGQGAATARQVVSLGAGQAATPAPSGAQFVLLGGAGGTDTATAFIEFGGPRSSLIGASFYDPDNPSSLTTPVVKPFAVRSTVYGCTISCIEFINAYRGLDICGGRTEVTSICGNPLSLGIRVRHGYDAPDVQRCHFVFSFVNGTNLAAWFAANSIAYRFEDNDEINLLRLFSYGYRVGAHFVAGTPLSNHPIGSYGWLINSGFDGGLYAVLDECTQQYGMDLTDVHCTPFGYGSASRGYWAKPGKSGLTRIINCTFWGDGDIALEIAGGDTRIWGCDILSGAFCSIGVNGTNLHADILGNVCGAYNGRELTAFGPANTQTVRARGNHRNNLTDALQFAFLSQDGTSPQTGPSATQTYNEHEGETRAVRATYPQFLWAATGNAANARKAQSYLDTNGDLVLAGLNDAENSAVVFLRLKRDGTSILVFPSSDPHVVGAPYWSGTTLTKSNG